MPRLGNPHRLFVPKVDYLGGLAAFVLVSIFPMLFLHNGTGSEQVTIKGVGGERLVHLASGSTVEVLFALAALVFALLSTHGTRPKLHTDGLVFRRKLRIVLDDMQHVVFTKFVRVTDRQFKHIETAFLLQLDIAKKLAT